MYKKKIIERLNKKSAVIGIFGLGYIGLPLALRYLDSGFKVIGFDVDTKKVDKLRSGESYIDYIPSSKISKYLKKKFQVTEDFSRSKELDALILCVPTPLKKYKKPDLSFVINTINSLVPYFCKAQILSLESTTYPGTTEEELLPRIEKVGLKVGKDFFLVYSPEREDPGNLNFNTKNIPKIVGGHTHNCLEVGKKLYNSSIDQIIGVSSTKIAEMTKLLENIHRAVNIGLVNEMKIVADRMNIDIHEVIRAASTKPFGFTPYHPGPGLGGHCIPIDPFYLTWKAKKIGVNTRFIKLAGEVNSSMPHWVIKKTIEALKVRGKSLNDLNVLVLGIAFKKNIQDTRESPGAELIKILRNKGARVNYSDPHVPIFPKMREYNFNLSSINLTPKSIKNYDLLILVTDHTKFDYTMIQKNAKLIIDTRGTYLNQFKNVISA
ncbi:nucleotide sugar dehydrogenase [Candidatus Pelagibacter sp.]|jgi:UDP-N-acetyl-D-glucosamine dehydrogenase|nr:nucleotide sugar dehydrogenase [Candidatus Pelagibacter sp.]